MPNPADGSGNWEDADRWYDAGGGVHIPWNSSTIDNAILARQRPGHRDCDAHRRADRRQRHLRRQLPGLHARRHALTLNAAAGIGLIANNSAVLNAPAPPSPPRRAGTSIPGTR